MNHAIQNLILSPDDAVDLQLHTQYSDGRWTPDALIDYLLHAGFALAAITDHDCADIAADLQAVAQRKGFPLLVAVEVSSMWHGELVDFLCYGFDPNADNALVTLAHEVANRQHANTRQVITTLQADGYPIPDAELETALTKPSCQHVNQLVALLSQYQKADEPIGRTLLEAGFAYATIEPERVVAAAHDSGAVCILAHPGGDEGFIRFDTARLDQLRAEAPFDGLEVYYPKHTEQQTETFRMYAQKHNLLMSSGSDSHSRDKPPIKYPASYSRALLEHLGVRFRSSNH